MSHAKRAIPKDVQDAGTPDLTESSAHVQAVDRPTQRLPEVSKNLWPRLLEWALLSSIPITAILLMKPGLVGFWDSVISFWAARLELPLIASVIHASDPGVWSTQTDGTFMPSSLTLTWTWLGVFSLWGMTHFFSDRFHPLKVMLRALCLVQGTACAFFMLAPASFPYTVTQHMHALLDMGYGLMLAVGPMLALGWGILMPSFAPKILAPLGVLTYFSVMLPHKVLLHAWVLANGSALFMPVLFLCFGALLDLWLFIALYAWLVSRIPRHAKATGRVA